MTMTERVAILVRLDRSQLLALDDLCARQRIRRSEGVRRAIALYVAMAQADITIIHSDADDRVTEVGDAA